MNVILYTTHCPQCVVLERLLKQNNVQFEIVADTKVMRNKGILSAPQIEVNGKLMNMRDAMSWLNKLQEDVHAR